ncbi:MAG: hypothetical protein NTY53_14465 [Kiritimatiellaeota bacterium]|nr:hypothetical protein [Kiritimatiellota bacterium]
MMRKFLKRLGRLLAGLVGLVVLFYAEEYVRGRWAWERHLKELAARGDSLDIQKFVPPPIPDDQNMAAAPVFAGLFSDTNSFITLSRRLNFPYARNADRDWHSGKKVDLIAWKKAFTNDDLTLALKKYDDVLSEIADAAQRPQARFPVRYEEGVAALCPHVTCTRQSSMVLRLRALVRLKAGQGDLAAQDLLLMLRLGQALENEPLLISLLVHNSIVSLADQVLWEGLQDHHWKEDQLAAFQKEFERLDLVKDLRCACQGERLLAVFLLQAIHDQPRELFGEHCTPLGMFVFRYVIPRGWFYLNCRNQDQAFLDQLIPCIDVPAQRIYPESCLNYVSQLERASEGSWFRILPYHYLEYALAPAFPDWLRGSAYGQTAAQQAALACALERYRLVNARLPEKLDMLVPQFIAKIPHDVMDGQPLRYRLESDGSYKLWSVGWNQKDDDGQLVFEHPNAPEDQRYLDNQKGDWVWQLPATK